uniref:Tetraspanin 34b n=1 Tax=Fundulus heteroclitus TaxID=8078 RepID=A0A3Q2P6C6_FUNHE
LKSSKCKLLKLKIQTFNLAGIAILGVGIWVKVDSGSIFNFLGKMENVPPELNQVLNVGYLLIAIGGLLVIIGFLGCCGAIRESRCMLLMVSLFLMFLFLNGQSSNFIFFTHFLVEYEGFHGHQQCRRDESSCCNLGFYKVPAEPKADRFHATLSSQVQFLYLALSDLKICVHTATLSSSSPGII